MAESLVIVIGGDTVPTDSNQNLLISGRERLVFNDVTDIFAKADFVIANLECPLTDNDSQIIKQGPCFRAQPEAVQGLIRAGIDIFSLANNHIMDYGEAGLLNTIEQIAKCEALYTGAGKDLPSARKPLFLEKNGYKISLLSVAEHEFSIAGEDTPGANPFDPYDTMEDIQAARKETDLVIILYHGGIEHYRIPSPFLQRTCRKMVDHGADYVICQHSHCIGSFEKYHGGCIVYGQGNLLFDYLKHELWQESLLINISVSKARRDIEFIPITKQGFSIALAGKTKAEMILNSFKERSAKLADKQYIKREWNKYADSRRYHYLQSLAGFTPLARRVDNRLKNIFCKLIFNQRAEIRIFDYLYCESHLETLKWIFRNKMQN